MRRSFSLARGFTLIEVLIVVAIIGILTAILVANYNDARKNSRDKIRKSELKELQLAIELYKAQNGRYPAQGCGEGGLWAGPGTDSPAVWEAQCDNYIVGLVPNFIAALPQDPNQENMTGKGFLYRTDSTGSKYKALVHNTVESLYITSASDEFSRCNNEAVCAWACAQSVVYGVYSAGAECW